MNKTVGIGLLGKGSTNHLHRQEVLDAFKQHGISIRFIVREDYFNLVTRLPGAEYVKCVFKAPSGWRAQILGICGYIRRMYPSWEDDRRRRFKYAQMERRGLLTRLAHRLCFMLARYRFTVSMIAAAEPLFYGHDAINGVNASTLDMLLLLGVGTVDSELEGVATSWARKKNIPVIHIVGNYDNLSSKGFRGVRVDRLLVWGPNMRDDAVDLHGINPEGISMIGPVRYNYIQDVLYPSREAFFAAIGLDPAKKTILFGGFLMEYHYFEMLEIYEQMRAAGEDYQLILRIYPNKSLLTSAYMKPLKDYASRLPGVYVSVGDPHYDKGERDREVLHIEEKELWNSLNYCDVVVNIFSTMSLEACLFDKPAINMWYSPKTLKNMLCAPVYHDYSILFHNRRIVSYGAIRVAQSRRELKSMIAAAVANPAELSEQRRKTVELECGVIDGKSCERIVQACVDGLKDRNPS